MTLECAHLPEQAGVETLAARHIHDRLAGQIADQFQQAERFDVRSPGLLFASLVLFGDGIIVGRHICSLRG